VIAVDSPAPLDLPRSSSYQQPLTIRHYKHKESDKSGSRPSTSQPYVIVEQFPFREIHAVPPHESSGFPEPALPSITGSSLPTTVHKPYPNSGVFRHYVPIEDRSRGPPSTNPTSPTEHPLPTATRMADSVLTPDTPGNQSDAVAPPIPNTESLASASAVKKTAGTKSKSKGKGKERATEAPVPSTAPAANLVPQLFQYPPYPVHPYFYLPPQYNPNAASPAYVYPGYPPIVAPQASGESPCVSGKPSGSAPAVQGASVVVPSPSSISASAPSQGLLTVPYPYPFPHPQAPGFHYAFPASASAPPSTATAGLGAVPFPYYYPYSASAPPVPSFLGAPLSAPLLPAAGASSTGELRTSISAPPAKPAPLSSPTSASTTVAKSIRPLKEPAKDPKESRFSYYHHGFGTTNSPDAPTVAADGVSLHRLRLLTVSRYLLQSRSRGPDKEEEEDRPRMAGETAVEGRAGKAATRSDICLHSYESYGRMGWQCESSSSSSHRFWGSPRCTCPASDYRATCSNVSGCRGPFPTGRFCIIVVRCTFKT
jgi:hypothetical protein